jgi:adenosylcobinamide-GDP ribazoletransferase
VRPDLRHQALLFVVAVQFLTRLPTPTLRNYQAQWLSSSARYFPLVGVLVGILNVVAWRLAGRVLPAAVAVGLMLAVSLLVTGAFHEDGFADACDGFGGGVTAERVLDIMKDSRIGAYGAIGIFMMLGLKWTVLTAMPVAALPLMVVSAHMVSRWCATALIWRLPYVRTAVGAKAKPFARGLRGGDWLLSGALGAGAVICTAVALSAVAGMTPGSSGAPAMALLPLDACGAALLAAAVITWVAAVYLRQRIGGYTGDCLGAVQQLSELGFLMTGLAVAGHP